MDKGILDVDWIISLAIFLTFLTYFFIYLQPLLHDEPDRTGTMLLNARDYIVENTTWYAQRIPVIIHSNQTSEPLLVDFPHRWGNTSLNNSLLHNNRIAFIGTAPFEWVLDSIATQSNSSLLATSSGFSNDQSGLSGNVDDNTLDISYEGTLVLGDVSLRRNFLAMQALSTQAVQNSAVAAYLTEYEAFNYTMFVVGDFTRVLVAIDTTTNESVTISHYLPNATDYYFSEAQFGTVSDCVELESSYLDITNDEVGVGFHLQQAASIEICPEDEGVEVNLKLEPLQAMRYDLAFHDASETPTYHLASTTLGMSENLSGISYSLFDQLNDSSYTLLKSQLGLAPELNYNFELAHLNGSSDIVFGRVPSATANVIAREFSVTLLHENGVAERRLLRVRTW